MKTRKPYWIKERWVQHLHYFSALGRLSVKNAQKHEKTLAGTNTIHRFETEADYTAQIKNLRDAGERVHEHFE